MASCLLNTETVELGKKLYKMTWWATAINQISVPSGMEMAGGSVAIITNNAGVECYHYNASNHTWKKDPAVEGGDISELENRVSDLESEQETMSGSLETVESNISTLTSGLATANSNISNLSSTAIQRKGLLSNGTDIGGLYEAGVYSLSSSNTYTGLPEGVVWGTLVVLTPTGTLNFAVQIIFRNINMFIRMNWNSAWTNWISIA